MLDLSHAKLSHTKQAITGGNLIAESQTDLGGGHGHLPLVVLEQASEVQKHTLRGLRTEEADAVSLGSNGSLEHQVEGERMSQVVHSIGGGLDVVQLQLLVQLFGGI